MNEKENLLSRITINSAVLVGKPTIRGMRISVEQIVKSVAAGISFEELRMDYPELEKENISAALLYAAQLIENEKVYAVAL